MYVVAGATGRVGSAVARQLIADGEDIRTLVRTPEAAERWTTLGAEARVLDLQDRDLLSEALSGSRGFFAMLPFDLTAADPDAHAESLVKSIAGAVADAGVPHVAMLSSGGADLAEGTGPIVGLHRLEQALRSTGTTLTALRSGHFQEKVGEVLDAAQSEGIYPVFASSADTPHPMAATRDIGAAAARALQQTPLQSEVVDLLGPAYSEREVAGMLGAALGRRLKVVLLPEAAWPDALVDAGLPPVIAEGLAELYRADDQGLLAPRGDRIQRTETGMETTIAAMTGVPVAG